VIKLVLLRHGQSEWNNAGKFTGWTDVDLSDQGKLEAINAGKSLKEAGYDFDLVYTSYLRRAIQTLWLVLEQMDLMWLPVVKSWRLNEHHYGALQGQLKQEVKEKFGAKKLLEWRRSYRTRPPQLDINDARYPGREAKYFQLPEEDLPLGESLEDTRKRFEVFWESDIKPEILKGKRVLIAAHGNSLRSLIMMLENVSEKDIVNLELPTGNPLIYELDNKLNFISKEYLLNT